jgi:hypothetical protein
VPGQDDARRLGRHPRRVPNSIKEPTTGRAHQRRPTSGTSLSRMINSHRCQVRHACYEAASTDSRTIASYAFRIVKYRHSVGYLCWSDHEWIIRTTIRPNGAAP